MDGTGIKQISLEDAEAQNNLEAMLPNYKNMTIMFGKIIIQIEHSLGVPTTSQILTADSQKLSFLTLMKVPFFVF